MMILLLTTVVVCSITFIMARTFHEDKALYINDLSSVLAVHISEKVDFTLTGYRDRMMLFTRLIFDQGSSRKHKNTLIQQVFKDFQEFISIKIYEEGNEPIYIYDQNSLEAAGLSKEDIIQYDVLNPVPVENRFSEVVYIENSTLTELLPTLSISIFSDHPESGKQVIVTAVIRLDKLMKITRDKGTFDSFVVDSRGNLLIHEDMQKIWARSPADWLPDLSDLQQQSTGTIVKFRYNDENMIGGFARTSIGDLITGVQIPEATAFLTARELLNSLIYTSLALLVITTIISMFLARYITSPLARLADITKEIAKGNFDVKVQRSSNDEIGKLTESFNTMASELDEREKALLEAREMAIRDGLTGLYNHRFFKESVIKEVARAKRHNHSFSLIFMDLDNFKVYNDNNGHPEGDYLLKRLSKLLLKNIRGTDILARYGGEEFVVLLPETTKNSAYLLAEKLRRRIEACPFRNEETLPLGKVTASLGVSTYPEDGTDPADMVKHADNLLYEAKEKGRNIVCV